MRFKWPNFLPQGIKTAHLSGIYIAESAGQPMRSINTVEAISSQGLVGDRYLNKTGYWDPVEGCQVTLISEDDLRLASKGNELSFDNGQHRRNLVVSGIKTSSLKGKEFNIGDALFSYEKPRPPCGYLNKIEGRGMSLALSYNSGICIRIIRSGKICVGDALVVTGSIQK